MFKTTRKLAGVFCCGLLLSCFVGQTYAQPKPKLKADASMFAGFDKRMKDEIKAGKIVGCSAMVVQDGKVVFQKEWGKRDHKKDLPVKNDTIWRIYSMTKPITSVAVMQLVEKGKIKLDEPVATYLPEFKDLKVLKRDGTEVECERAMTVRDLLRHTSGLTYGFFGNSEVDKLYKKKSVLVFDKNIAETVTKLSKIPLLHQPGTRWHYSVSTDVLGRVIEVASKKTFAEYLSENIFKPLKMSDTFFTVPKDKLDRLAEMYRPSKDGLKPANKFASIRFVSQDNEYYSGGGGLCSTMNDYLRFSQMMVNGGELEGAKILKPETIKQMTTNQLTGKMASRGFKFGLGFRITNQGHFMWGGAAGTRFWCDPKNKIAGVYMIQINPYRAKRYGDDFCRLIYKKK